MHRQRINPVVILLDHLARESILGQQNHSQLGAAVELRGAQVGVIDLVERGKVDIAGGSTVHLARLKDDTGCAGVRQLGRLAQQGPQLVDGVVVAQVVDAKVAVDAVGVEAVLVRVDACRQDQEVEAGQGRGQLREDGADLREIAQVAVLPLDLGVGGLALDLGDGVVALLLLAVDHDDTGAGVGEGARDLVSDAQGTTRHDGDVTVEVFGVDGLGADAGYFLQDRLHGGGLVLTGWMCVGGVCVQS